MLDYIKGTIAELNPAYVVVENQGLGYMINISLNTYDALARISPNQAAMLYVHEAIREDAHLLYGFADKRERELFLLLISVSGVGVNTARMILSSMQVPELEASIAQGSAAMLKSVKGVGAKTAQRIIVDLKDKIKVGDSALVIETDQPSGEIFEEAMSALVMLGFTRPMSQKALKKLLKAEPGISVEDAIKKALKMM